MTAQMHQVERRLRKIEQRIREWSASGFDIDAVLRIVGAAQAKGLMINYADEPEAAILSTNLSGAVAPFPVTASATATETIADIARNIRVAVDQAALARWPVLILDQKRRQRVAASLHQLLRVVEPVLTKLEGRVSAQEQDLSEALARQKLNHLIDNDS
jgi:hypothetical protein